MHSRDSGWLFNNISLTPPLSKLFQFRIRVIAWKMSKYGVFSVPHFPVLGLNTEIYWINACVQSEYRKIRTRKTPYLDTFHAVRKETVMCTISFQNSANMLITIVFWQFTPKDVHIWSCVDFSQIFYAKMEECIRINNWLCQVVFLKTSVH